MATSLNLDAATVAGFGEEWSAFDQAALDADELQRRFWEYFSIFPLDRISTGEGFDLGCGSGRWSALLAPRVGHLHCIDPAEKALASARRNLAGQANVTLHQADAETIPLADASQDFGACLGVLHHLPDPAAGMAAAVAKLKPGAPFLVYLYYDLSDRPAWFRAIWRTTDLARRAMSRMPFAVRRLLAETIALVVYLPLASAAGLLERMGKDVSSIPLSHYRTWSFYSMRTDALDRFGTRIEHRFSRDEVREMMEAAGLANIRFSEGPPYWVACGRKL